jgi:hypothetical protein
MEITATMVTVTENILTLLLVASHFDDSLRALTSEADRRKLNPKADGRGQTLCSVLPFQHRAGNNGNIDFPTVGYHATQQYRSGERIQVTIAATVT